MWLYLPPECLPTSACAAGPEESTLASSSSWAAGYAPYVTLNGKQERRPRSWRRWKQRPWIALLSGLTCEPSTAARGVAAWISSLPGTRASRSPSPADVMACVIRDISGPTSGGLLSRYVRHWSSSRTSQGTLLLDLAPSEPSYDALVTEWRRDYSARRKWASPTSGPASSYWHTPTARNADENAWARMPDGSTIETLPGQARNRTWPTPRAEDSESSGERVSRGVADTLTGVVKKWPTPKVSDWKGADPARSENRSGARHAGDGSSTVAPAFPSPLPDPTTSTPGHECSPKCRRLNPLFVSWLMGWPLGWPTVPINSGSPATESSRSRPRSPSSPSGFASATREAYSAWFERSRRALFGDTLDDPQPEA